MSCICLCKDTNFKANHNELINTIFEANVVYAYAKILILKQITTYYQRLCSQVSCICLCKDTNFKANHNSSHLFVHFYFVVYAYAKILILKQITTHLQLYKLFLQLYMPMQRY